MWKSFRLISSNPKRIKCIFIGNPKQLGIPPNSDPKAIWIVSWIGSFLEEKFLSKELSGRMVETWWGYWTVSSTSVWQGTGSCSCGTYTNWSGSLWYWSWNFGSSHYQTSWDDKDAYYFRVVRDPVLEVMLLDNNEPTSHGEAMMSLNSNKWLEAMKSEIGSIY